MAKLQVLVCAVAAVTFWGLPVVAQEDAVDDGAGGDDADGAAQVMDDELPPGDSASEGEDAASDATPRCVPRPPKDASADAAVDGEAEKGDEDLLSDGDEKKEADAEANAEGEGTEEGETEGPEMSDVLDENGNPLPYCEEKPYVPVEPPPVISDEIDFSAFGDNENSAAVRAAKADYMAVAQVLDGSLEGPYKRYLVEMHRGKKKMSFSEFMYDDYYRARTGGILFIGIGVPIFGTLTALGAVFLSQGLGDDCLPANDPDEECEPPQRNDAEEKRDQGIFLLAVGTAGTVASVVIGAIKIKRANGPLNALKPLITGKQSSARNHLHFNGLSPVVATSHSAGPGTTLSFTF